MARISKNLKIGASISLIALLTALVFLPSLKNGFVNWDDDFYVLKNPDIRGLSFGHVKKIAASFFASNYQPLTILSYSLDYRFFGLNPFGYHLTNLLLHLFNGCLVFWLACMLGRGIGAALVAGVLFGIHPLHVESVAWVSERKDVLCAFFFLGSLISYLYYCGGRHPRRHYYLSLGLFVLALLSKAMAITLPLALLLVDYRVFGRIGKKELREKIPFFILSLVFGIIAVAAQHSGHAIRQGDWLNISVNFLTASFALVFYLGKILWPAGLSCLYPYAIAGKPASFLFLAAPFFVAALGLALFFSRKFSRNAIFCGLFFLITILPVLQFIPIGQTIVADRYAYIPSVGLFYGAGVLFLRLLERGKRHRNKILRIFLFLILTAVACVLGVSTWRRCGAWKDSRTLWKDVLAGSPDSATAYTNLGMVSAEEGKEEEAAVLFNKAIEIDPRHQTAYNNLGKIYTDTGRNEEAVALLAKAVAINPHSVEAYNNLCKAYSRTGQTGSALSACGRAIEINPAFGKAYNNLAVLYHGMNKNGAALQLFRKAVEIDPEDAEAYSNLGSLFFLLGDKEGAVILLEKAIELNPVSAEGYCNLGAVFAAMGRTGEAIVLFRKAIEIKPAYAEAYGNLSLAYFRAGQPETAVEYYHKARALNFTNPSFSEELKPYLE